MNKKTKLITLALAVGVVGTTAAFAQPGGHGREFFPVARMLHDLKLTDAQEEAAIRMQKELRQEGKALRQKAVGSLGQMGTELQKPKPDAAALHRLADERIADMGKLVHATIDRFLAFHATLTPEQRTELAQKLQKAERRAKLMGED